MLWNHDVKEPIGKWNSIAENEKGLKMEGKLVMEVARAREAYALAKEKVVQGLSIGWDFMRDKDGRVEKDAVEIDEKKRTRYLKRVELFEVSLVTFPANTRANITGVKGMDEVESIRNFEYFLRDAGMSAEFAKSIISKCKELSETERLSKVLSELKTQNARLYVADMLAK
jgi:HK97 family phage prohead protease